MAKRKPSRMTQEKTTKEQQASERRNGDRRADDRRAHARFSPTSPARVDRRQGERRTSRT